MRRACRLWSKRRPWLGQGAVEGLFAGVAEGRMADVVDQREGFGELHVQPQGCGQRARDLRHFQGVRQAAAEVVAGRGSPGRRVKTWVLPARRRKARAWRMRAPSRAKGER